MKSCEIVTLVSTLSCFIAKDKTDDELALPSAIFTQLGDSLATIAVTRGIEEKCNKNE